MSATFPHHGADVEVALDHSGQPLPHGHLTSAVEVPHVVVALQRVCQFLAAATRTVLANTGAK